MPFVETYAVNFSNGNLHPHVNLHNWPDMQLSPTTPNNLASSLSDSSGRTLRITRTMLVPGGTPARFSLFVVPPPSPSDDPLVESRLLMRLTFDLPTAKRLGPSQLPPGDPPEPEPWAVALSVSPANDLSGDFLPVTCQFHRERDGVRLNTPGGLQNDQAGILESPLNYKRYGAEGHVKFPSIVDSLVDPPLFTLAHSFCGRDNHIAGGGFLEIARRWRAEVRDQRVYSNDALSSIGSLGILLGTNDGRGQIQVRLRTFSISFNEEP